INNLKKKRSRSQKDAKQKLKKPEPQQRDDKKTTASKQKTQTNTPARSVEAVAEPKVALMVPDDQCSDAPTSPATMAHKAVAISQSESDTQDSEEICEEEKISPIPFDVDTCQWDDSDIDWSLPNASKLYFESVHKYFANLKNNQNAVQLSGNTEAPSTKLKALQERLTCANLSDIIRIAGNSHEVITKAFKDFFGDSFMVNLQSDNTYSIKVSLNVGETLISALKFYHIPHGAQTIKAWPQWRYAFLNLLQEIESQLIQQS
ncbi:MAG: hypothetical protein Q8K36_04705, partial [Alphaproteobacteria bacterium]|nr:hypothetical protein [Alphaproteobacteria bacterium]